MKLKINVLLELSYHKMAQIKFDFLIFNDAILGKY